MALPYTFVLHAKQSGRAKNNSVAELTTVNVDTASNSQGEKSMTLLHEQYESDGNLVLFRCRECGYTSLSVGNLHAHVEGHRGYTRFNIQLPYTKTSPGDFGRLMDYTDVLMVESTSEISLSDVEGL